MRELVRDWIAPVFQNDAKLERPVVIADFSLDNVLFKVNPSLRQAFLQVIDVTNLCFVGLHALLHNTSNFITYRSISMKHTRHI